MPEKTKINNTEVSLIRDDLTNLDVEAIVFYARSDLTLGSGYGNAISTRGGPSIKKELDEIGKVAPLGSVVSSGGNLNTKHIIHSAGPVFMEEDSENKLAITINNALKCAGENGISQVAFPIMGIGFYGIPIDMSVKIMIDTISQFASNSTSIKEIIICANDNREYRAFQSKFAKFNKELINHE